VPGAGRGFFGWDWVEEPPLLETHSLSCHGGIGSCLGSACNIVAMGPISTRRDAPIELQHHYVSSAMAGYLNTYLWVFFGLFGILGLTMLFHRDKIERVR